MAATDNTAVLTRAQWDEKEASVRAACVALTTALFGPRPSTPFPEWTIDGLIVRLGLDGGRWPVRLTINEVDYIDLDAELCRDLAVALNRAADWDDPRDQDEAA